MPFYEVQILATQTIFVEADSEEEALEVGCENYSALDFEFDEGRLGMTFENDPGDTYGKVIYK